MALNSKWTRTQHRAAARREIMDSGTKWVTDAQLNTYLDDWEYILQHRHELVWNITTFTSTGSTTLTLTDVATGILRPGFLYWEGTKLVPRTQDELSAYQSNWRSVNTTTRPIVMYSPAPEVIAVWPPVSTASEYETIWEYATVHAFASDADAQILPGWTRYSSTPYLAMRVYANNGPLHDLSKAERYRAMFENASQRIARTMRRYWPKRSPALRPASAYELDILAPRGQFGDKSTLWI